MSSARLTRKVYRRRPVSADNVTGRSRLSLEEEIIEVTEPTDVLIQIRDVSLNYRDANMLNGTNPWSVLDGGIPCSDAVGVVVAVGPKVTKFREGDIVSPILDQHAIIGHEQTYEWLGSNVDGVLATHCKFLEEKLVRPPEHLTSAEAACLPCAGLTAWNALGQDIGTPLLGKTVLVQGTGGVSLMVLKFARAAGCKVILTSSSDEKLDKLKQAFTQDDPRSLQTINYKRISSWDDEALRLNGGRGVDIVIENGGTTTLPKSLKSVAKRGVISQVGYLGHQDTSDPPDLVPLLIEKAVNLRGINIGSRHEFEMMNRAVSANSLRFEDVIDKIFKFEQAAEALEYLWSGQHVGKVIIQVASSA